MRAQTKQPKPTRAELERAYANTAREAELYRRALADQLVLHGPIYDSRASLDGGELILTLYRSTKAHDGYVLATDRRGALLSVRYLDDCLADLDPDYTGPHDRYQLTLLGFKTERERRLDTTDPLCKEWDHA